MKKKDLATLAMIGLASGMMVGCQGWFGGNGNGENGNGDGEQAAASLTTPMTAQETTFADKLNTKAKPEFENMNTEQRKEAMDRTQQSCKGNNTCKGMGGCKTDKNACKGQNDCKGQGGCSVDASTAVGLVEKSMKDKRSNMTK